MLLRVVSVLVAIAAVSCHSSAGPDRPEPAAPLTPGARVAETPAPTLRLPTTLTARAYRAHLALDPAKPDFTGELELDATLAETASVLWLAADEIAIAHAEARTADGTVALTASTPANGFVALRPARDLAAGELTLAITYTGSVAADDAVGVFAQSVDGAPYLFSQFEPAYARRAFPCIDDPSSKAPWTVTLDVPSELVALSNMPVARETALDGAHKRLEFAPTPPLPSYLIAFAIGPFELVDAGKAPSGVPIRVAAFHGRAKEARYAAENAAALLASVEAYFGTPLPYPKLDLVPVPSTTIWSAMENAGMITFHREILLFPEDATIAEHASFDSVALHEMAHQWFGDLVTLAWWDDTWLNEAFATWMSSKLMRDRPSWSDGDEVNARASGALADELATARRIRQPVERAGDIQSAFDGITYSKGAAVVQMFERYVGEERFRDGVRAYIAKHAEGVADARAFLDAIDAVAPEPVSPAFATFLDQAGIPAIEAKLRCAGGKATVTLRQERWLPQGAATTEAAAARWQVPVCIAAGDRTTRATTCALLRDEQMDVDLSNKTCPTWFLPNDGGAGYYRMVVDDAAFAAAFDEGWRQLSTGERILLPNDGRALARRGDLSPAVLLEAVPRMRDAGPRLFSQAMNTATSVYDWTDDAHLESLRRWIRTTFGPRARKAGWLPRKGETAEELGVRFQLLRLVGYYGRDARLLADARKVAKHWRTLPRNVRSLVLGLAIHADPELGRSVLDELDTMTDLDLRDDARYALSYTTDPKLVDAILTRLLDPERPLIDEFWFLWALAGRDRQPQVEAFVRAHAAELIPRLPDAVAANLARVVKQGCDAARRDDQAAWLHGLLDGLPGGERKVNQTIEAVDQCVAQRAHNAPLIAAWLKKRK
jgi:alanyl aminopeptidase